MNPVLFHVNVPDPVAYACRLLRRAYESGAKVVVTGPADLLQFLDQSLWSFEALAFVPHCLVPCAEHLLKISAVVLTEDLSQAPHQDILLNLGPQVPAGFERFARVNEIVGCDEEALQLARQRWRAYVAAGCAPERFERAARA